MAITKGDKRIINGWAFYDWANSVYPLVISTAIFPTFYQGVTATTGAEKSVVQFLGFEWYNTTLYDYAIALAFLIVAILSPMLSGIADYAGNKKGFLKFFCYLGAVSVSSLYFFDADHLELSFIPVVTACVGFWGSLVFYNAYLPEIAHPEDQDRVSAKGFTLGYIGSSILLILCLLPILLDPDNAGFWSRVAFVVTGVWWVGFAQVTYLRLPADERHHKIKGNMLKQGFQEIKKAAKIAWATTRLRRYLIAFFIFSMGVQTLMLIASFFAMEEVGMSAGDLIIAILIIQFLGAGGAYLTSKASANWGNLPALRVIMVGWAVIVLGAYFVDGVIGFYVIAFFVGLVMGGTQSLARSTYSKFLPENTIDTASFFSFYDVLEKIGIVIGMLSLGTIHQLTGSWSSTILWLMAVFALGAIALMWVPKKESARQKL